MTLATFFFALLTLLLFTTAAHAAAPASQPVASCSGYPGVANRIAGCVLESVDHAAQVFFYQFYPYLANAIGAVTILGVALYGVLIAFQLVENVGKDTIMLVIKIAVVSFFVQNTNVMYGYVTTAMSATAIAVTQVVPKAGDADGSKTFDQITCLGNMLNATETTGKPVVGPWLAIDCMLDSVIGIKQIPGAGSATTATTPSDEKSLNKNISPKRTGMSRGLLFFFFSGMETSVTGLILGVIGMLFLWSLITLTMKTLLTYITGYIGVTFMIIISPLFIPLVLLPGQAPKQYFEKWYTLLIGFAMQPILMLVFITLFICAIDLAMFSGDYSIVYRVAGEASRQPGFDINKYLAGDNPDPEAPKGQNAIIKKPFKLLENKIGEISPKVTEQLGRAIVPGSYESDCAKKLAITGGASDPACKNSAPVQFYRDALDWEMLAKKRQPAVQMEEGAATPGEELAREVIASAIFCAVILFVMNRIASVVPAIVTDLMGLTSPMQSLNMYGKISGNISKLIKR